VAMGKRKRHRQTSLWVETARLAKGPAHPFYRRLNQILGQHGFDEYVERACQGFYADKLGRPSLPPAVYFRLLLIGYFEGIDSERGIAGGSPTRSRCATSWATRWPMESRTTRRFLAAGG
jgi:transposase